MTQSRGRPRSAGVGDAIKAAAWELLAEKGYDSLTMDDVIASAGCGRNTVYRRYSSKRELILSLFQDMYHDDLPAMGPDDDPREVLIDYTGRIVRFLTGTPGQAMVKILEVVPRNPELAAIRHQYRRQFSEKLYQPLKRISAFTPSREVLAFVEDTLAGALHYHTSVVKRELSDREISGIVDSIVGSIRNSNAMYYPLCQLYLRPVARVSNGYFSGISEVVVIKIDAI